MGIDQLKLFEDKEYEEAQNPKLTSMVEGKMGDLRVFVPEGNPHEAPERKIAREKVDEIITAKAETRADECWFEDCDGSPHTWIREIQFDLAEVGNPINVAHVSTSDYDGPIPGLCMKHEVVGVEKLVEAVCISRPEIQWGYRPERWIVIHTDGIKREGVFIAIDPFRQSPEVVEDYTPNGE